MKGISRAAGAAAVVATALAACSAAPVGPDASGPRPSLLVIGTGASVTAEATSLLLSATCTSPDTLSGNSTYIVAYGTPCAPSAPAPAAPLPPPDSTQFKLSFR